MSKKRIATIYDFARFCAGMKNCNKCPLSLRNNNRGEICNKFIINSTYKANEIILKWCDEHPLKTYLDDYLEKLPDCRRSSLTKMPVACVNIAYGLLLQCLDGCSDCWNRPMEGSDEQ